MAYYDFVTPSMKLLTGEIPASFIQVCIYLHIINYLENISTNFYWTIILIYIYIFLLQTPIKDREADFSLKFLNIDKNLYPGPKQCDIIQVTYPSN